MWFCENVNAEVPVGLLVLMMSAMLLITNVRVNQVRLKMSISRKLEHSTNFGKEFYSTIVFF